MTAQAVGVDEVVAMIQAEADRHREIAEACRAAELDSKASGYPAAKPGAFDALGRVEDINASICLGLIAGVREIAGRQ